MGDKEDREVKEDMGDGGVKETGETRKTGDSRKTRES